MPENTGNIAPLAWQRYVEEALRRRKAEGLTQKHHSALAGVSHPTMAAFERGETTLTLAKALDILRVVGLVDEPTEGTRKPGSCAMHLSVGVIWLLRSPGFACAVSKWLVSVRLLA